MADIYATTRTYRDRLIRREARVLREMLADWRLIEAELKAKATAVGALIESRAGLEVQSAAFDIATRRMVAPLETEIPLDWLYRQERVTALLDEAQRQIALLSEKYGEVLTLEARGAAMDGAQLAARQLSVSTAFGTRLSVAAVESIAAATRVGPLAELLSGVDFEGRLREALVKGIARGANPRAVAREVSGAINAAKQRTLTIARTEMARAQKQATFDSYRAAGVTQYQWLSAQDASTCPACWGMDGQVFDTYEEIDDHPNGRCAIVPVTEGEPLGEMPDKQQAWNALSESDKLKVLGPSRYDLVSSGLPLDALATPSGDLTATVWGKSASIAPLTKLAV